MSFGTYGIYKKLSHSHGIKTCALGIDDDGKPIGSPDGKRKLYFESSIIREAIIYLHIKHQNIASCYSIEIKKSKIEFQLEHCGDTMDKWAFKKPYDEKVLMFRVWFADVINALMYLHQTGIVHGDLKPNNICISHGGAKLIDFGGSSLYDEVDRCYKDSLTTYTFKAPEAFDGDNGPWNDVWSLGVCMAMYFTEETPELYKHNSRRQMVEYLEKHNMTLEFPDIKMPDDIRRLISLILVEKDNRPSLETIALSLNPKHNFKCESKVRHGITKKTWYEVFDERSRKILKRKNLLTTKTEDHLAEFQLMLLNPWYNTSMEVNDVTIDLLNNLLFNICQGG